MKKHLTFLLFTYCCVCFGQQSVKIFKNGVNIEKTTITIPGTSADEDLVADGISVVSNINNIVEIRTKRYELSYVPESYNFICWGVCEAPFNHKGGKDPFYILNTSVKITDKYDGFSAHYLPQGTIGSSEYRYVFFDIKNPTDSAWFNVVFSTKLTNSTGIDEEKGFKIYPNPATETVKIDFFESNETSSRINIFNIMGSKITSLHKLKNENSITWNLTDDTDNPIENGLYFCQFMLKNQSVTKKIMVKR